MTCVCIAKPSSLGVAEPLLTQNSLSESGLQGIPVLGYFLYYTAYVSTCTAVTFPCQCRCRFEPFLIRKSNGKSASDTVSLNYVYRKYLISSPAQGASSQVSLRNHHTNQKRHFLFLKYIFSCTRTQIRGKYCIGNSIMHGGISG